MSLITIIKAKLADLEAQRELLLDELCAHLMNIPQNKDITGVSKNSFTINGSSLASFAPSYYNFKYQTAELVIVLMRSVEPLRKLDTVLKDEYFTAFGGRYIRLHPEVITYIKTLYDEPVNAPVH